MKKLWIGVSLLFLACGTNTNHQAATLPVAGSAPAGVPGIQLPDGFEIAVYASGVKNARGMALGDDGTVYVGSRSAGQVHALIDSDGDQVAETVKLVAKGLKMPSGLAFRNGALYVAEVNRILRYDNIAKRLDDEPDPLVLNDDLPSDRHHGWKYLGFGPDGKLYFPVGAPCNICLSDKEIYATIMRMDADGSNLEVFAEGVRNSVGFDWHPGTKELWFTENGRDWLGDDMPPDELNCAYKKGLHFGYPFCHAGFSSDPEFGDQRPCTDFEAPAQKLGPHVAAVGMTFYTGSQFPEGYKNKIFLAEHGSWNRSQKIGYRIMMVTPDGRKGKDYKVFAEGWLKGDEVSGRPADVMQLPDGSLLVSDDFADKVYRITYKY